jgi:hypothetical protein
VRVTTWQQTGDRRTWRGQRGRVVLTVTKTSSGAFRADAEGPGVSEQSPEFRTRLAAQRWCENKAGVR